MADKTLTVTVEYKITDHSRFIDLLREVISKEQSTSFFNSLSIWDYDPEELITNVQAE